MGLHAVAVAKLHLQLASHSLSPAVAGMACTVTLALKLLLSLRIFREEAVYAVRLFFFRLGHIAFNDREMSIVGNGARLERALRLLLRTVTTTRTTTNNTTPTPSEDSEAVEQERETFHALSMLTL